MARFTVRIQLDGYPSDDEYKQLHRRMKSRGFIRFIFDDEERKWYRLPHAEYNGIVDLTRPQVLEETIAIANAVAPRHKREILVTESNGRSWAGLDEVSEKLVREADL